MEQEKLNQESDVRQDVNITPEPAAAGAGVQGESPKTEENK